MNMFKKMMLAAFFLMGTASTASALQPALETVNVSGRLTVRDSETKTLWLGNARFIKNIVVQAVGTNRDSMVEVMVNGEVKGTIYAPGRDPSYVVTIGETASSIQFRHRSGGSMEIFNVVATLSTWSGRPSGHLGSIRGSATEVVQLAQRTLLALEKIHSYATLDEERTYLLPIRKKAGRVIVMAEARGDLSRKTSEALVALQLQIDFAATYLDSLLEQDGLFDASVELLTVRESIDDLLD